MKRKIILSITFLLILSALLLTSSDSRIAAQNRERFIADTGIITLGPNQVLSVAAGFDPGPLDGKFIRFRQIKYTQEDVCSAGGVCKYAIASQTISDPVTPVSGEVLGFDHIGNFNFRAIVLSNSQNLKVHATITNSVTGEITAVQMSMQRENQ